MDRPNLLCALLLSRVEDPGANGPELEEIRWVTETTPDLFGNRADYGSGYRPHGSLYCPWCLGELAGVLEKADTAQAQTRVSALVHADPARDARCALTYRWGERAGQPAYRAALVLAAFHTYNGYLAYLQVAQGIADPQAPLEAALRATDCARRLAVERARAGTPDPLNQGGPDPEGAGAQALERLASTGFDLDPKLRDHAARHGARVSQLEPVSDLLAAVAELYPFRLQALNLQLTRARVVPARRLFEPPAERPAPALEDYLLFEAPTTGAPGGLARLDALFPDAYLADAAEVAAKPHAPVLTLQGLGQARADDELHLGRGPWAEAKSAKEVLAARKEKDRRKAEETFRTVPFQAIWDRAVRLEGYQPDGSNKINADYWFPGRGNPNAKVWLIGLHPSTAELKGGRLFDGPAGVELSDACRDAGLSEDDDVYVDNVLRRALPPKQDLSGALKREQEWVLRYLLAHYRPERVICLGAQALEALAGSKHSVKTLRGRWERVEVKLPKEQLIQTERPLAPWVGNLTVIYNPAHVLRDEGRHELEPFRADLRNLLANRQAERVTAKHAVLKTRAQVEAWVQAVLDRCETEGLQYKVATDIEATGLDLRDELVSWGIGVQFRRRGQARALDEPPWLALLCHYELPGPEYHAWADYQSSQDWLGLNFGPPDPQNGQAAAEAVPLLATSAEHLRQILQQRERYAGKDLRIFVPFKATPHLKGVDLTGPLGRLYHGPACYRQVLTNTNFDRQRIHRHCGFDLGANVASADGPFLGDTSLGESVLNENGEKGLKHSVSRRLHWAPYEQEKDLFGQQNRLAELCGAAKHRRYTSPWSLYPWSVIAPYAAMDLLAALTVDDHQLEELEAQRQTYQTKRVNFTLRDAYAYQCGAVHGIYEMECRGMPVNFKRLRELTAFYHGHLAKQLQQGQDAIFRLTGDRKVALASDEQLAHCLFRPDGPLARRGITPWKSAGKQGTLWSEIPEKERHAHRPSVDNETFEILASNTPDPEVRALLTTISNARTIMTICSSFLPDLKQGLKERKGIIGMLDLRDMVLRTSYRPTLDTHRCSSQPNLSTFPNKEVKGIARILGEKPPHAIREIVEAPPGHVLLYRDWMTAEVVKLGLLSQDPKMLAIIAQMRTGTDFHCMLAEASYGQLAEIAQLFAQTPEFPLRWFQQKRVGADELRAARKRWARRWVRQQEAPLDWFRRNGAGEAELAEVQAQWAQWRRPQREIKPLELGERHQFLKAVFDSERSTIKPVTFGVPYGRTPEAIQKQINRDYFVHDLRGADGQIKTISLEECRTIVDAYKQAEYSVAWGYLTRQAEFAIENGYLLDHWGYVRHFPKGLAKGDLSRKAYNWQIQHGVAVLMNHAMRDWAVLKGRYGIKHSYAQMTLYDAMGWVVHEDELQKVWDASAEIMTLNRPCGPPGSGLERCRIPTDGKFCQRWNGPDLTLAELGVVDRPEYKLTGLEGPAVAA